MNLKQRLTLIIACGVMSMVLLFPPFVVVPWAFDGAPNVPVWERFAFFTAVFFGSSISLNLNQWLAEIGIVVVVATEAMIYFRDKN